MFEYLQRLINDGEIRIIKRTVDPRFELAAVTHLSQKKDDLPILFRSVKGSDMPVVSNVYGSRQRLFDLVGAEKGSFCRRWTELSSRLNGNPDYYTAGAYPGNRVQGELRDLPLITYREKEPNPYFTSAIYLAKDPENGIPNLSFNRSMYVNDNELRVRLGSSHDLYKYYKKAEKIGAPLEAAILIGSPPEIFLAACASLPMHQNELESAALIKGAPLTMHRCATIDLLVPSETEIIIEGRFLPGTLRPEGPFGEFMGYYVEAGDNHVFDVTSVSWRKGAFFHSLLCGSKEDLYPLDLFTGARIYQYLSTQLPGIVDVTCYPCLMNTIVKIQQQYEGHARHVLLAAFAAHLDYSKSCMVVDEDVDIYDLEDIWWAYLTRGRADKRAFILNDMPGFYRDPKKDHWGRLAIDATKPFHRQPEFERARIPGAESMALADYED